MNPLHLESIARDRQAGLRSEASAARVGRDAAAAKPSPDPRVPRRGPLSSLTRLSGLVRQAVA